MIARVEFSIYPASDEVEDVYARALAFGWTLFEQTMPILAHIEPRPQDDSEASYYFEQGPREARRPGRLAALSGVAPAAALRRGRRARLACAAAGLSRRPRTRS